jgi:hypothetical protein
MTHGVNNNRRVPCSVSVHHGHFPSNERCSMCGPPEVKTWVPDRPRWGRWAEKLRGKSPSAQWDLIVDLIQRGDLLVEDRVDLMEYLHYCAVP